MTLLLLWHSIGSGILIVVAVGIDGDPFDELWALLQILWFLPILMVGMGVYVAMWAFGCIMALDWLHMTLNWLRHGSLHHGSVDCITDWLRHGTW
jgi:hypothetical protein